MSVDVYSAAPTVTHVGDSDATAKTTFPQSWTFGFDHNLNDMWRLMAEYAWTEYSRIDKISVMGTVGTVSNPTVDQKWKDQHNVRIGAEYTGFNMPVRFGYGWTSQVTNKDYARAAFTPPGDAHTLTAGTGYSFETCMLNAGLEYTWAKASGNPNGAQPGNSAALSDLRNGNFSVEEYALHLGFTQYF